jgi:hypothetical protein
MLRLLLLASLSLALLAPARASAESRLAFASPDGVAEIPFDLHNNHICMRGQVGDSDSLWIVLDTGAGGASMSASRAQALGLKIEQGGTALGAGGRVQSGLVRDATVRLAGLELVEQDLGTLPLDGIALQSGRPMDVILGHALLSRAVVEIDYAARVVRVFDPAKYTPRAEGTSFPLAFRHGLPYVKVAIELRDRAPIEGEFVLDTGASSALTLTDDLVQKQNVLEAVPQTIRARMGGVGGPVENRVGRIERLRIGPYAVERPVTVFRLPGAGQISAPGTAGNIGGEILRRFRVTFDYRHERMTLEPNAAIGEPFEADMSGLVTQVLADSTRALQVLWTQEKSPASEAGIVAGDVIEALDGRPVAESGPAAMREMFRRADATYSLTVRRGGERREVKLTMRRLI